MKRLIPLVFLTSLFTLVGCNKSSGKPAVKYEAISQEEFDAYFSDEAKSYALANFSTIQKVRFTNYQDVKTTGYSMKYTLNRDLDENYFYEYGKMVDNSGTGVSHALYIGDEDTEKCSYYEVSSDGSKVETGSDAISSYNYAVSNVRNMVSHSINNYLFLAKDYMDLEKITAKECYLGDDESIKIIVSSDDNETNFHSSATLIFDSKTLLVKYSKCDINSAEGKGYIKSNFKYNVSFSHKTPKDIGYKAK